MRELIGLKYFPVRLAAIALFLLILWGCGRVPQLDEYAPPSARLPFVRVLLDETSREHTISSPDKDEMAVDCYKGEKRISFYSRKPIVVKAEDNKISVFDNSGRTLDYDIDQVIISPRSREMVLSRDGKSYRGLMQLAAKSGQLTLVNLVHVEDYLRGVVPLEFGPVGDRQTEAIKAQAVAARTYAMGHLGQYTGLDYDLKSDVTDQVYGGLVAESMVIDSAINATRGQVEVYKDKMINAYYFSTCGGKTDDIEDVWDKEAAPYLVAVDDDSACGSSKYFHWQEKYTGEQITLRLEQYLSRERGDRIDVGRLTDIKITNRTPGGRVASIVFETTSSHYVFNKEKVRWIIHRSESPDDILRSAKFTIDIDRNSYGEITYVTFNGRGWGHGVGMCQMGAKGLSEKGITYDSILSHYYSGTNLKKLY
jgi:stage II sporulation protein D